MGKKLIGISKWKKNSYGLNFLLIFFLILTYYLIGINWDLPHNLNGDECIVLNSIFTIKNNFGNHDIRFYGSPYIYLQTVIIGINYIINLISGDVKNANEFITNFICYPTTIIILGRLISVLSGVFIFFTIFGISKKILPKGFVYYPSLIFCFAGIVIFWVHFSKMDIFNVLLFNLSLLYLLKASENKIYFWRACILTGISITCKLPSVVLVCGIFVLVYVYINNYKYKLNYIIKIASFLLLGVFIGDPWAIIDYKSCIEQVVMTREMFAYVMDQTKIEQFIYYINVLIDNFSLLFAFLVVAVPLGLFIWKPNLKELLLLIVMASFLLLLMTTNHASSHWILPILPTVIIISISNLVKVFKLVKYKHCNKICQSICVIISFYTFFHGLKTLNQEFLLPDTKYLAKKWIEENIKENSKIAMDRGRYIAAFTANLIANEESIENQIINDKKLQKDFLASNGKIFINAQKTIPSNVKKYNIFPLIHGETDKRQQIRVRSQEVSIQLLRDLNVEYILASDGYYNRYFKNDNPNQSKNYYEKRNFYNEIFKDLIVVKKWEGNKSGFRGPNITLFKI